MDDTEFEPRYFEIQDKRGQRFVVREHIYEPFYTLHLLKDGRRIGYCNFMVRGELGELHDINLYDEPPPATPLARLTRFLMGERSYRGLGLGSQLLQMAEDYARSKGVTEVTGWISKVDMAHLSKVVRFYRRSGYDVSHAGAWEPLRSANAFDVARIRKVLSSSPTPVV